MVTAATFKLVFSTVLLVLLLGAQSAVRARPLVGSTSDLVARLRLDEEPPSCWESMFQLQSCTGEVIMFFLNGETFLGPKCCDAIRTIQHDCWPDLMATLGYTTEEGDVLEGYCDGVGHNSPSLQPLTPKAKINTQVIRGSSP